MRRAGPWRWASALGLTVLLSGAAEAGAQARVSGPEAASLRDASTLEARGDHPGAERVLRSLLTEFPTSTAALFAIERALRAQGRIKDVLPLIDGLLTVEPRASAVRTMKLRILVEADSLQTLEREAREWIQAEPGSPDPYRELARMYERAYGMAGALTLLREGRGHLAEPAAFAVEIGDLLERSGQYSEAAGEWSLAIGDDGGQSAQVIRRIAQLAPGSRALVPLLLGALDREPTTVERRYAGVLIALEAGLFDDALRLARSAAEDFPEARRRLFFQDLARRGDDVQALGVSLWAYEGLRPLARTDVELREIEGRIVATALVVGDTTRALAAQSRVAGTLPIGSTERSGVLADRLGLQALVASPDTLRSGLDAFRREFPDAPELDELASAVAFSLLVRGHGEAAAEILDLVSGPRSSLERAYLHLEQGDLESGVQSLQEALAALSPSSATEVIQLVSLLGRVSPQAARALGRSAVLSHRGSIRQAADRLEEEIPRLPPADRSAVLAQAARLADSMGDAARGADLRFRLVEEYPDAPEMADAALALARWRARSGQVPAAIALLEWLIVQRPNSPVVPDARRELDRIKGRGLEFVE